MTYQHGGDIYSTPYRIDFSANINPLGTPQSVIRAAQEAVLLSANYPDASYRELAQAIAGKEQIPKEHLICGNGAAELIFLTVQALQPKKALLIAPGFSEYEQALKAQGCEICYYKLKKENGFRCESDYTDFLKDDLDLIFLCSPNNPTGILTDREQILQIIQICHTKGIRMILDSCFTDFLTDEAGNSFVSLTEEYPNLFILKAFTKIYAMAGLRLGYGICSDTAFLEVCKSKMQPWSISIPAQMAGVAALKETDYVENTKKLICQERAWLYEQMKPLVEELYEGQANFLFFRSTPELGMQLQQEGILIRDCSNYRGLQKGYYRIAVRTHQENEELIRVLKKFLK